MNEKHVIFIPNNKIEGKVSISWLCKAETAVIKAEGGVLKLAGSSGV